MEIRAVDPENIPQSSTRRNSKSGNLVRAFLDSGAEAAEVSLSDGDKSIESVRSTLGNFIQRHKVPVKVFSRGGNLYLQRVAEGTVAPDGDSTETEPSNA